MCPNPRVRPGTAPFEIDKAPGKCLSCREAQTAKPNIVGLAVLCHQFDVALPSTASPGWPSTLDEGNPVPVGIANVEVEPTPGLPDEQVGEIDAAAFELGKERPDVRRFHRGEDMPMHPAER